MNIFKNIIIGGFSTDGVLQMADGRYEDIRPLLRRTYPKQLRYWAKQAGLKEVGKSILGSRWLLRRHSAIWTDSNDRRFQLVQRKECWTLQCFTRLNDTFVASCNIPILNEKTFIDAVKSIKQSAFHPSEYFADDLSWLYPHEFKASDFTATSPDPTLLFPPSEKTNS